MGIAVSGPALPGRDAPWHPTGLVLRGKAALWVGAIALLFVATSLKLLATADVALNYWYLTSVPIILAGFRFGRFGALVASIVAVVVLLAVFRNAGHSFQQVTAVFANLSDASTLPDEARRLAAQLADFSANEPMVALQRAMTGLVLVIIGGVLLGTAVDHRNRAYVDVVRAYEAVAVADRQLEEFLALVSHDLRQPVIAISTVAEALAKSPRLTPDEHGALDGLREQAQSLAVFAGDVLSISQHESGHLKLNPVSFDLGAFVAGLARHALETDRIEVDVPSTPVIIEADPARVGQAIDNLLRNALVYSPGGAPVLVRVRPTNTHALIEVVDRGVGFNPTDTPRLFQKYSRLPRAGAQPSGGFGLGLYLSRLMVEAQGGRIEAESPGPGNGATFRISFPRSALSE